MMKIPDTYEELGINIFANLFTSSLSDIFIKFFGNQINANLEFVSEYKSRKLSSLMKTAVKHYGVYSDDIYLDMSDEGISFISQNIVEAFEYKWRKILTVNETAYDALKPFNITLSETASDTLDTQKDKTTYVDNDGSYGFNSNSPVPTDKTDGESNREYKRTIDNTRDYTRIGNIGNTSFQELIEQERKIADYEFKWIILRDISTIICRGKYI